jgi:hypothetical protein
MKNQAISKIVLACGIMLVIAILLYFLYDVDRVLKQSSGPGQPVGDLPAR